MKKNNYFRVSLVSKSTEEAMNNTFVLYVMAIMELTVIAILQGEFNLISVGALITDAILLCVIAYRKGSKDAERDMQYE